MCQFSSVQFNFSSVIQSCPTVCDPMNHSTPGLSVHHQLPEFTQTQFHGVGDAIQPSHPLSFPSPTLNLSQHESLFRVNLFFPSHSQSIGVSASASVLPMNTQDWSPLGWTGWISLQSKGLSKFSPTHSSKASILWHSAFFVVQLYFHTWKTIALTRRTSVGKVMSLLFNMLSRLIIAFLPKKEVISWLHSPSTVILKPKNFSLSLFPFFLHLSTMQWWDLMPWS